MRPPKTLVIGATGFVGSRLLAQLRRHHPDCLGTTWRQRSGLPLLDLLGPDVAPLRLVESGYTHAIIAAAVAGLSRCEEQPEYTRARNVDGTLALAHQLAQEGVTVVFFSSDNVFDGVSGRFEETMPPSPINEYGRQKAEVEARLPEITGGNYLVLRLAKMFGTTRGDGTILDEMAARLARCQRVTAAYDQLLTPMHVDDAVTAVLGLLGANVRGVAHVAGPETWSRWDLAREVARAMGLPEDRVERVSLADLSEQFARPRRNDLVARTLQEIAPMTFTPITASIAEIARQYLPGRPA